jgi:hypothetical protein
MRFPWSKPTLAERAVGAGNIAMHISLIVITVHEAGKRIASMLDDRAEKSVPSEKAEPSLRKVA